MMRYFLLFFLFLFSINSYASYTPPLTPVDVITNSVTMQPNHIYYSDDGATLVTFIMPSTCSVGSQMQIVGVGSGGFGIQVPLGSGITINFAGVLAHDTGGGAAIFTQAPQQSGNTIIVNCFNNTLAFVTFASGRFQVIN